MDQELRTQLHTVSQARPLGDHKRSGPRPLWSRAPNFLMKSAAFLEGRAAPPYRWAQSPRGRRLEVFIGPLPAAGGPAAQTLDTVGLGRGSASFPGYTPAHFSTLIPNKRGLEVNCRACTNKRAKDKMLLGRQDSWLLLPAVGSPSNHIAEVIMFDLFTLPSSPE